MFKRTLLYVIVMLILLALAVSASQWSKNTALLEQQAVELSAWIQQQEKLAANGQGAGTVITLQGDTLTSWSNTYIIPSPQDIKLIANQTASGVASFPQGYFWVKKETTGNGAKYTLVPLKYSLTFNQLAIANPTPISSDIQFHATQKSDYPVIVEGKEIGWLKEEGFQGSIWVEWLTLAAWILFFGLFLRVLTLAGNSVGQKFGYGAGAALVTLVTCSVLFLNMKTGFTAHQFDQFRLFQPAFEQGALIGHSIGDWLLHSLVLVYLMGYFHQTPLVQRQVKSGGTAVVISLFAHLLAMFSIGIGAEAIRQMIFLSKQNFDFDRILLLGVNGFVALAGVVALMVGLFLFSHRLIKGTQSLALGRNQRYAGIGIAAMVLALLLSIMGNDANQVLWLTGFGLVYGFMLDAMVHWQGNSFGWGIFWLVMFSFFSSSQLYRHSELRDQKTRMQYAQALAEDRDTIMAEKFLPRIILHLMQDASVLGKMLKPWPFKAEANEMRDYVNRKVFAENYLFQHYRLSVFAFDKDNQPILLGQTLGYEQVVLGNWATAKPISSSNDIRFGYDEEENPRYIVQLALNRMEDPAQPASLYLFFDLKHPAPSRTYTHLFFNSPLKGLSQLPQFDFSIVQKGKLTVDQGLVNMSFLGQNLAPGASSEIQTGQHIDAVAKSANGQTIAAVGRNAGSWLKQVYLFSIIFTLASLCLVILALVNTWVKFLPSDYDFRLKASGSLARRIHFWNVTLLAIAFGIVGYLTYQQFTHSAQETEQNDFNFRATAILTNLKAKALNATISDDSLRRSLPLTLTEMSTSLGMDIHFYDPAGNLVYATQEELVRLGVLPAKMNPAAMQYLKGNVSGERVESEQAAGLSYQTQYRTLHNNEGKTLGYLAVPFVETQGNRNAEVSDFIGMLASLYVFLLLIAFGVTYMLARSVIRPVSMLSEKVQVLRLEDKNEPLDYVGDSEDEISQLISQYNTMVEKLEASKTQLVKLEREGAWREMARQVAHDIKNPLTTMKLSMQQLERLSGSPEQAAAYLRKAITRLIEQIDSLAQIASEFSMFANLDIKTKNDVVINEVVESVHDLFSEQKHVDLSLSLPEERFHILGDKNHLIRVFNNLVINAIQAIPSDRRGQIHVSLSRKNNYSVIQISDNGGGIPPEIRERVFEPNFTTKTSGSGLGLAICKKIIEAHDGTIRFETRDNEGTDFFVEVPVVSVD
ncbi:MAG TPA: HAMP domain-containing sensor histidine kinase [Saprospiraceae bacterium]|nr:HAMP domain-containing sensor histidine kinase [Saprospiraceae bacterium]